LNYGFNEWQIFGSLALILAGLGIAYRYLDKNRI
jgi:hypothetical protein